MKNIKKEGNAKEYLDAELYDIENQWGKDDDFYLEFIKNKAINILDLGCGTGRLTRKLAELANEVVGLDVEKKMLERARKLDVKKEVEWVEGNFLDFNLGKKFSLILCTSHGFQHILTKNNQDKFFKNVFKHLKRDGIFIFDTRNFKGKNYGNNKMMELKREIKNQEEDVIKVYVGSEYDEQSEIDLVKIRRENTKTGEKNISEFVLKYTDIDTLNSTLKENGFKILKQFGSFEKEVFNMNSPEIISVCIKK